MIWTDYFNLIKVLPGRIVTPRFGSLDFGDPSLPVEKIRALFEDGFPYLELTPLGKEALYPLSEPMDPGQRIEPEQLKPAKTTLKRKA
ncbi:MAG: hypothetical protein D4R64_13190 [Porphyromonadaceae bacterium]|nr:MAG: hypothetical protein D4R64_13190 [Porphyromonadaceae bacterium]